MKKNVTAKGVHLQLTPSSELRPKRFASGKINQEIDRPSHYGSKSGKDVIDWCEDFGIMSNAYVFNIFKYLVRAGRKSNNSDLQDALKARVYLDRYIKSLEEEN